MIIKTLAIDERSGLEDDLHILSSNAFLHPAKYRTGDRSPNLIQTTRWHARAAAPALDASRATYGHSFLSTNHFPAFLFERLLP
jgi:hypothetical protein